MTLDEAMSSSNSSNHSTSSTGTNFLILHCLKDSSSLKAVVAFAALNILLLPLYILVLYVGYKQWRQQQQQGALSGTGTSDLLTYNLALVEIIGCLSSISFACSSWAQSRPALAASYCLFVINFFGEALFHCTICLDKYLAVVHPITYRNLREARTVQIRNVAIGVCWLCFALWIPYVLAIFEEFPARALVASVIFFTGIVLYCCLSALYVLTRPGPGGKKQVDQTKLRAFHIISAITGLLIFKMIGILMYLCFYIFRPFGTDQLCLTLLLAVILITPANVLIPVLYLRRMKQSIC